MNNELYTKQLDDAQQLLGIVLTNLSGAKDQLFKSGHPGVRLSNRKVDELLHKIKEVRSAIDNLPAPESDQ